MNRSGEHDALSAAKRELLARLLAGEAGAVRADPDRVRPRPDGAVPPISAEQAQVWLHAALAGAVPLYNEPITIHRRGSFDLGLLEDSFNELLRRHEIWRTGFERVDGQVQQRVAPALRITLPLVDLSHLPLAEREAEALRLATEDARRPFDLARAPLFRARVLKLAEDEHRLHLTLHHIIFDGVSIYRTVMPELVAIYEARARGVEPDLPAPELQYGDYALWRERSLRDDLLAPQLAYWMQQLAGELPVLRLPTDHPRPAQLDYRGSMETFELAPALTRALKALSQAEGATLYMVLLAAFKALLHRYGGQEDLLVGGVVDMRHRPELERLVGYFLNSVVLRTRPRSEMRFSDYLREVRGTVVGAVAASDVPFDRVVRALHPHRDPSAHPLFQILFSMEPPATEFGSGWDLTQMEVTVGAAKFDLYLELDERPDCIIGRFLYSTELFERATILRMINHWTRVLEAVADDPTQSLGALPVLGEDERQLLEAWNRTERPIPPVTVQDWIAQQAKRRPEAAAVRSGATVCSYGGLERRAEEIAAHLRAAGVGPGALVGICAGRTPELLAGLLGILKTGAAYLPLDPDFPKARLDLILEDAAPALCLVERRLAAGLPSMRVPLVLLEDCVGAVQPAAPTAVGPDDVAYVLYTSGSTGRPKGVEIPHRALVNLLASMQREPGFAEGETLLSVTTISFDIAALELFLPLVSGGTVVLADSEAVRDPRLLARLIEATRCDVMQATPATWRGLLDAGWRAPSQLRILCGGEALPRPLADRLRADGAALWNVYGPTETTIWSTLHKVEADTGPVPIGRPIANTKLYVLDAHGRALPVGAAGELHIGGAGLARGYRSRDALTRERFVTAPAAPGERLYRTGDLARYRQDGTVEWLGRLDQQVKVRGFRVELEDVETALLRHDAIAAAAVRAWPDASGSAALAAYVVGRDSAPDGVVPTPESLRDFLRQHLPDYMVPSQLVTLPNLPLTPNGKVDRNALPRPVNARQPAGAADWHDATEAQLATLWMEVLGVAQLGAEEDFFQLGGHSLLAAQLLVRIEQAFGHSLPIAAIFRAPTVRYMAAMLREPRQAARGEATSRRTIDDDGLRLAGRWRAGLASLGARLGRASDRAAVE
jgi:amino acid adenylation domain-containing protein